MEIAKFDTQKLQNPDIKGIEYQKGVTEGYDNVRAYVFERDNYTCQICKKPKGILQKKHPSLKKVKPEQIVRSQNRLDEKLGQPGKEKPHWWQRVCQGIDDFRSRLTETSVSTP